MPLIRQWRWAFRDDHQGRSRVSRNDLAGWGGRYCQGYHRSDGSIRHDDANPRSVVDTRRMNVDSAIQDRPNLCPRLCTRRDSRCYLTEHKDGRRRGRQNRDRGDAQKERPEDSTCSTRHRSECSTSLRFREQQHLHITIGIEILTRRIPEYRRRELIVDLP